MEIWQEIWSGIILNVGIFVQHPLSPSVVGSVLGIIALLTGAGKSPRVRRTIGYTLLAVGVGGLAVSWYGFHATNGVEGDLILVAQMASEGKLVGWDWWAGAILHFPIGLIGLWILERTRAAD